MLVLGQSICGKKGNGFVILIFSRPKIVSKRKEKDVVDEEIGFPRDARWFGMRCVPVPYTGTIVREQIETFCSFGHEDCGVVGIPYEVRSFKAKYFEPRICSECHEVLLEKDD